MLLYLASGRIDQDGPRQPSAQRPQLRAVGRTSSTTPQLIIPAETGRVREGDPVSELLEWID
ncbi:hypothetical protein P154DRAFT_528093 [Amniculicola lignicola CBS 123094]|uniref:Uncharacterized protein n=1 Tax=Amniculicola lignicola CBS 123094 TaxID=1392246 RepID=A0A6A5W5U2_9PLEO|nr:hypothetical protein P154DRAFT_528093 [Amniculicola lignicola CBS 123094]